MPNIKTAISLPEAIFNQADALAKEMRIPRSRLFALATEAYIRHYQNQQLLEAINSAYAESTEEEEALAQGMRRKHKQLVAGEW